MEHKTSVMKYLNGEPVSEEEGLDKILETLTTLANQGNEINKIHIEWHKMKDGKLIIKNFCTEAFMTLTMGQAK